MSDPSRQFNLRGRIYYTEMYDMLKNMDPPLGFGSKCPDRLAFKKLIRMNQPIDDEGMVHFTTTLFALIRENLNIKMRAAEEMDQADLELRTTIIKVWPYEGKEKIDLLVPPREGESLGIKFISMGERENFPNKVLCWVACSGASSCNNPPATNLLDHLPVFSA